MGLGERETGTTHGWLGKNCFATVHTTQLEGARVLFIHISLVGFQYWLQGTGAGKLEPSLPLPQRPIPPQLTARSHSRSRLSRPQQSMDDLQKIFGGLTGIKPSKSWDIRQESLILIHWFCRTFYRRPDIFSSNCKVTIVFFSFKPIQGTKEVIWGWSPELDKGHAYGWSRYTSPKRQWHDISIKQLPSYWTAS